MSFTFEGHGVFKTILFLKQLV